MGNCVQIQPADWEETERRNERDEDVKHRLKRREEEEDAHRRYTPDTPSDDSPKVVKQLSYGMQRDRKRRDSREHRDLHRVGSQGQGHMRQFSEMYGAPFKRQVSESYKHQVLSGIGAAMLGGGASTAKKEKIASFYHDDYFGQNELFLTPFGVRPALYCDWTASGKNLKSVETFIQKEVLTLYANTHTSTSITGVQTSKFRSEARTIILESLKGEQEKDCVIFTGSGVTGAIYKLANVLMKSNYNPQNTVVFISVYEHNSNIYIWKELGIKVVVIPENKNNPKQGHIDLDILKKKLQHYTSNRMNKKYELIIGSFTAASNVSGIIAPIDDITRMLHQFGALSFWDFATAGPYLDINMTNKDDPLLSKDAVFISTHKYLGGPNTPGILCAKRNLFQNYVPVIPGGGTVFYAFGTKEDEWRYMDNIEEKEEGGTPDIIGSIRAAFPFILKDHLGTHFIEEREKEYVRYFFDEIKDVPNIRIMGNTECDRLPILSFAVLHESKRLNTTKYLHYNFIAALFNDLFGIQGRGGCSCAGMYGLEALALTDDDVAHIVKQMTENGNELSRPGYFRINLHYTLTRNELKYIVDAVKFVCRNGWRFVPLYDVDVESGVYYHRDMRRKPELDTKKHLRSLLDVSFDGESGAMQWNGKHAMLMGMSLEHNLPQYLAMAHNAVKDALHLMPSSKAEFKAEHCIDDEKRWYWLPSEIYDDLNDDEQDQ